MMNLVLSRDRGGLSLGFLFSVLLLRGDGTWVDGDAESKTD
jgi:hypothetical protein